MNKISQIRKGYYLIMGEILKFFMSIDSFMFTRVMGLFWLFAESFCLVFVRWGYYDLLPEKTDRGQRRFVLFLSAGFMLLVFLTFSQDLILERMLPPSVSVSDSILAYYYSSLWRLFCTLWVLIEGVIAIYVVRISGLFSGRKDLSRSKIDPLMLVFLVLFSLIYISYEVPFFRVVLSGSINWKTVMNISRFYIKLCGFFWIFFEWVVAILGWRIYRSLSKWGRG